MRYMNILRMPDIISVKDENNWSVLKKEKQEFRNNTTTVKMCNTNAGIQYYLNAPKTKVEYVLVRWQESLDENILFLGDHWERGYGDLQWRGIIPNKQMPWYFFTSDKKRINGYGVKTQPSALCSWFYDGEYLSLLLDVRCGGKGVCLGDRTLLMAEVISYEGKDNSIYEEMNTFCKKMCDNPRIPKEPVYGGNNWYYAYGNFTQHDIIEDSKLMKELSDMNEVTPFMILDDGWQVGKGKEKECNEDAWSPNTEKFPKFKEMISNMKELGVKPGIWFRPLLTTGKTPSKYYLKGVHEIGKTVTGPILDPSIPEVLEIIKNQMKQFAMLGFELVKHDFTTYDCMGRWGVNFNFTITDSGWSFSDNTKTTAEIYKNLYSAIREGAGNMIIIGCNTFSHLSAGYFEIQRTGDDTSGKQWERTRKMGVNTLAFRMAQHNAFYAVDADCVGITKDVDWNLNKQWLDVLGKSGTPLFVSVDPKTVTEEQKQEIKLNFKRASKFRKPSEPLDFLSTTTPRKWKSEDGIDIYNWTETSKIELCSGYLGE